MNHYSRVTLFNRVVQMFVGVAVCFALAWGGSAKAAFSAKLQGLDNGSTTWGGGPLDDWAELDDVPCRVQFTGGPVTGQIITIEFDHFRGSIPAI